MQNTEISKVKGGFGEVEKERRKSEINKLLKFFFLQFHSIFRLTDEASSAIGLATPITSSPATPTLPPISFSSSRSHSHFSSSTWSPGAHFPMIPIEAGLQHKGRSHHHSNKEGGSHYEVIKKLIESQRKISRPLKLPHPPQPAAGNAAQVQPNKHRSNAFRSPSKQPNTLPPPSTALPPNLPAGLSPELTKYISEVWRKHAVSHF